MYPNNETWQLGDSPAVGVLLSEHAFHYRVIPALTIGPDFSYQPIESPSRTLRVYDFVDSWMILEDFFAKLAHWERTAQPGR
jgi:hypothetical protein